MCTTNPRQCVLVLCKIENAAHLAVTLCASDFEGVGPRAVAMMMSCLRHIADKGVNSPHIYDAMSSKVTLYEQGLGRPQKICLWLFGRLNQ